MPIKIVLEKKEELSLDMISKMADFEIKLKELELLAEDLRKIKIRIDLINETVKKIVDLAEPKINTLECAELNRL
jgi:hypothetical protein